MDHFIKNFAKSLSYFVLILMVTACKPSISTIYVYEDEGVSEESLQHTLKTFKAEGYPVQTLSARDVKEGAWRENALVFIMPGGADLPYCKKLNGCGNQMIRDYVEGGGVYLGFCAGAYYASGFVAFDEHGILEVVGDRELKFFPGTARGPALAQYDYQVNSGVRAGKVSLQMGEAQKKVSLYFEGGPFFEGASENDENMRVLGVYDALKKPAMIQIKVGKGLAILSGVHFEYDSQGLDSKNPLLREVLPILKEAEGDRRQLVKDMLALILKHHKETR